MYRSGSVRRTDKHAYTNERNEVDNLPFWCSVRRLFTVRFRGFPDVGSGCGGSSEGEKSNMQEQQSAMIQNRSVNGFFSGSDRHKKTVIEIPKTFQRNGIVAQPIEDGARRLAESPEIGKA
jgi:hypothetical protein